MKKTPIYGKITVRRMVEYAMFASLMFTSKQIMEALPNIHLIGMFILLLCSLYRVGALIPIYLFVLLEGVIAGFSLWWIPYLYIWAILWAVGMLIPDGISDKRAMIVYPVVCGLHGLLYGILYAPAEALLFGLNFKQTVSWVLTGLPFDLLHCAGNAAAGLLVVPLKKLVRKISR